MHRLHLSGFTHSTRHAHGRFKTDRAPLRPLIAQLVEKQLTEDLFHNDETGWKVFEAIEGKVGYRWYLWVTQSSSVVY